MVIELGRVGTIAIKEAQKNLRSSDFTVPDIGSLKFVAEQKYDFAIFSKMLRCVSKKLRSPRSEHS